MCAVVCMFAGNMSRLVIAEQSSYTEDKRTAYTM